MRKRDLLVVYHCLCSSNHLPGKQFLLIDYFKPCDIRCGKKQNVLNWGGRPTGIPMACDIFTICRSLLNVSFFNIWLNLFLTFFLKGSESCFFKSRVETFDRGDSKLLEFMGLCQLLSVIW